MCAYVCVWFYSCELDLRSHLLPFLKFFLFMFFPQKGSLEQILTHNVIRTLVSVTAAVADTSPVHDGSLQTGTYSLELSGSKRSAERVRDLSTVI